jgi:hypothetical protein
MIDSLLEMPRILTEISRLSLSWLPLLSAVPKGEPHPVMVLPGFAGGDDSTLLLRRFLTSLNYKALPWLQGVNTGRPELLEGAMRRVFRMHHTLGTPISLVGQSLGGVFAREITREFPDAVRCVITLGSPYGASDSSSTNPMVMRMFEELSGMTVEEMRALMPEEKREGHLPVPTTSVYSKQDGVVAWKSCIEPETDLSENIRVRGSHTGMAMNPDVLRVVADRLAQQPDNWKKFQKSGWCDQMTYPRTDH